MAFETTKNIWRNGQMIAWEKAQVPCDVACDPLWVFGLRGDALLCAAQGRGDLPPAAMRRMLDSAKIYRMPLGYTLEDVLGGGGAG